ncbi:helix-turn-helix domain-containing protein [Solicola sp. PLA-1-18]|uniref:helix-turn-helix domain-containing protein n=1 Tax=Solicola sp. PLA-1-18 TaxID=3380532 RepID=UPI003B8249AC
MHDTTPPRLVTPAEAAAILHVSPTLLRRWAMAGRLSAARTLGGHWRFRLDDVMVLRATRAAAAQA